MIRSIISVIGLVFLSIGYGCSPASVLASGGLVYEDREGYLPGRKY